MSDIVHYRRNAEMEKEIADLRRRLANSGNQIPTAFEANTIDQSSEDVFCDPDSPPSARDGSLSVPVEPQSSTLHTPLVLQRADASILLQEDNAWRLEDISLSRVRVARLFEQ